MASYASENNMNALVDVLSSPAWRHLTVALLHSLWQGFLVALALAVVLRCVSVGRPTVRYAAAFGSLLCVFLGVLLTWAILDRQERPIIASADQADFGVTAKVAASPILFQNAGPSKSLLDAPIGAEPSNRQTPWCAFAAAAWLLGVAVMFFRMIYTVFGLRRIAAEPESTDTAIRATVERLRMALRLKRTIRTIETVRAIGPAVLGVVRPVLILPLGMATGLPPEALQAILAHELAHVRRHDYLWNLVQMVVESLLFFNPAVWWINRRIRAEREACCDAVAAGLVGDSSQVAESLALWAERVRGLSKNALPSPAAAWLGGRPQLLLDRVRRICVPGYRPPLPVSPLGFLGFLLLTAAAIAVLWRGTSAAVEIAAKILTPEERIERVEQVERKYVSPSPKKQSDGSDKEVVLSGTIRTWDGRPLPKRLTLVAHNRNLIGNGLVKSVNVTPPSFTVEMPAGTTWLCLEIEGYAPAITGPMFSEPGQTFSNVGMVLEKGTPRTIRVTDENGKPVAGAMVGDSIVINGDYFGNSSLRHCTGDAGNFTILTPRIAMPHTYSFDLSKPGFQTCSQRNITLRADSPTTLILPRAKPLTGELLSPEGRPVAGVNIRQYIKVSSTNSDMSGHDGRVLAVTDARGRFTLDTLEDDASYLLVAESEEFGRQPIVIDSPRPERLLVRSGPLLTVSGVVLGPLKELENFRGKPCVSFSQPISLKNHSTSVYGPAYIETVNGELQFTARELLPGDVVILAGKNHRVQTTVNASTPHQHVTIDLTQTVLPVPPAKRPVVLRLTTPDGSMPRGTIHVRCLPADDAYSEADEKSVPIQNGVARVDAYVSSRGILYSPRGLLGYWFENGQQRVEPGKEPLEIVVPVMPAGAIAGQVLDANGKPVSDRVSVSASGRMEFINPNGTFSTRSGGFAENDDIHIDHSGRFWVNPLPLTGKYVISASRGHVICCSSMIELTGTKPTVEVTLSLPRTTIAEGTVVDADGKPLAVPLELSFVSNAKGVDGNLSSHGWSGGDRTDRQGRFRFDDLGVGVGEYFLYLKPRRDFQPCRVPLPLDGKPVEIRLKRGLVLEGEVVDDATGRPATGLELVAMPAKLTPESIEHYQAEALTDQRGRFRFSNLGDQSYKIMFVGGPQIIRKSQDADEETWAPGEPSVSIRVKIPEWYRPRQ